MKNIILWTCQRIITKKIFNNIINHIKKHIVKKRYE
jgi:hypothetical protein